MQKDWSAHLSANSLGSFHVVCISSVCIRALLSGLEEQEFKNYTLDLAGADSKASLLAALAASFGITSSGSSGLSNWDAAGDLIWQVLMERPERRVAFLLNDADVMIRDHLQLFLDLLEFIHNLCNTLERHSMGKDSHPVLLRVVLLGEGPGFRRWELDEGDTTLNIKGRVPFIPVAANNGSSPKLMTSDQ